VSTLVTCIMSRVPAVPAASAASSPVAEVVPFVWTPRAKEDAGSPPPTSVLSGPDSAPPSPSPVSDGRPQSPVDAGGGVEASAGQRVDLRTRAFTVSSPLASPTLLPPRSAPSATPSPLPSPPPPALTAAATTRPRSQPPPSANHLYQHLTAPGSVSSRSALGDPRRESEGSNVRLLGGRFLLGEAAVNGGGFYKCIELDSGKEFACKVS